MPLIRHCVIWYPQCPGVFRQLLQPGVVVHRRQAVYLSWVLQVRLRPDGACLSSEDDRASQNRLQCTFQTRVRLTMRLSATTGISSRFPADLIGNSSRPSRGSRSIMPGWASCRSAPSCRRPAASGSPQAERAQYPTQDHSSSPCGARGVHHLPSPERQPLVQNGLQVHVRHVSPPCAAFP